MSITRSFYFIRHGQTDWNKELRLQGNTDIPLNETGKEQARSAFERVSKVPVDIIVVSHLQRAKETAEILNQALQKEIIVDPRICEKDYGDFEGKTKAEYEAWKLETGSIDPPNGETYTSFKARIISAFNEHLNNHKGKNILFVAHGGVYRVLHNTLLNCIQSSDNAVPYLFDRVENNWRISKL